MPQYSQTYTSSLQNVVDSLDSEQDLQLYINKNKTNVNNPKEIEYQPFDTSNPDFKSSRLSKQSGGTIVSTPSPSNSTTPPSTTPSNNTPLFSSNENTNTVKKKKFIKKKKLTKDLFCSKKNFTTNQPKINLTFFIPYLLFFFPLTYFFSPFK